MIRTFSWKASLNRVGSTVRNGETHPNVDNNPQQLYCTKLNVNTSVIDEKTGAALMRT